MKEYAVINVCNLKTGETGTLFVKNPEGAESKESTVRKFVSYIKQGFTLTGFQFLTEEDYKNLRLDAFTESYCSLDRMKRDAVERYLSDEIQAEEYENTVTVCNDLMKTLQGKIHFLVEVMNSRDYDVKNEVALQLNDEYIQDLWSPVYDHEEDFLEVTEG